VDSQPSGEEDLINSSGHIKALLGNAVILGQKRSELFASVLFEKS